MMTGQPNSPHWKMFWFSQNWQYVTSESDKRGNSLIPWIGTTEKIAQDTLEEWSCITAYAEVLEDSCIPEEFEELRYDINNIKFYSAERREEVRQDIEKDDSSYLDHGGWCTWDDPEVNVPDLEKDDLGKWFSNWVATEGAKVNPAMRTFDFDVDIWTEFK